MRSSDKARGTKLCFVTNQPPMFRLLYYYGLLKFFIFLLYILLFSFDFAISHIISHFGLLNLKLKKEISFFNNETFFRFASLITVPQRVDHVRLNEDFRLFKKIIED